MLQAMDDIFAAINRSEVPVECSVIERVDQLRFNRRSIFDLVDDADEARPRTVDYKLYGRLGRLKRALNESKHGISRS